MTSIRLIIVGDTQRVLPIEQLAFGRETNDVGRSKVAQAILAEPADGLLHLGDLIGSASGWDRFDRDYPPEVLSSKPIHVCRGNHDCGGAWFGSPREFNRRFPQAIGRLQEIDLGFLRLLLLDTNKGAMSQSQWHVQMAQFEAALVRADGDAQVKQVLVAGHHPPFTNGRWHRPSRVVLDSFVVPFVRCQKARSFFAGHVHGYERFEIDGKSFVVTGGGGGARFRHQHGHERRTASVIDLADPHPLHFITVEASRDAIAFSVRGIDERSGDWLQLDQWTA